MKLLALALALLACRREPPPPAPPAGERELERYLAELAGRSPEERVRELAGWPVDRAVAQRVLVEPYRGHVGEVRPEAGLRALAAQLGEAPRAVIAVRKHYAGDPRLTPGQAWLRWVVPPVFPSYVAELDGHPLETVLFHDGARWRALVGLDALIAERVRALDEPCAALLAGVVRSVECANTGWAVADAALRTDRERFARACRIAASHCGKRSP